MIDNILLEVFQSKVICKKAVSKGWCKESSYIFSCRAKSMLQIIYQLASVTGCNGRSRGGSRVLIKPPLSQD